MQARGRRDRDLARRRAAPPAAASRRVVGVVGEAGDRELLELRAPVRRPRRRAAACRRCHAQQLAQEPSGGIGASPRAARPPDRRGLSEQDLVAPWPDERNPAIPARASARYTTAPGAIRCPRLARTAAAASRPGWARSERPARDARQHAAALVLIGVRARVAHPERRHEALYAFGSGLQVPFAACTERPRPASGSRGRGSAPCRAPPRRGRAVVRVPRDGGYARGSAV